MWIGMALTYVCEIRVFIKTSLNLSQVIHIGRSMVDRSSVSTLERTRFVSKLIKFLDFFL
jgi:hypothetical protein